jgi:sulfur carrier protein
MQIIINGETRDVPEAITAAQLIDLLDLANKRLAIEANKEIVPRSEFETHTFNPGDQVEIVQAIGGG